MQNAARLARFFRPVAVLLALAISAGAAKADTLNVSTNSGYARLLFNFAPKASVRAQVTGGVLILSFSRKSDVSATTIAQNLPNIASGARVDPDGQTYRFTLGQPFRIHSSVSASQVAIDLVPDSYTGTPPDLPPPPPPPPKTVDVASLPLVAVRSSSYQNFTRLVFDWPKDVKYSVFPGAGKLGIRFEGLARIDLSALARFAPPWVKNAAWRIDGNGTIVEFDTDQASGFHDFRAGNKIVLDVLAPKTDADAYNPPGDTKPTITPLKPAAGISAAQAAAVATAVQQVNGATKPSAPAPEPAPPGETKPAAPPPETALSEANGQVTGNGAVLVFANAANRATAVFVRGLTAWVVLQDAAPLDVMKLKTQLGDFPSAVEATSSGDVSILRVTLKKPADISARADGSSLRVTIGPAPNAQPSAIGFSRNQDDATHSSLTTLLPNATSAVTVTDPVVGDQLVIVPAAVGNAMLAPHEYIEFGVLKTAAGLAVTPYVDDLSVTVDHSRIGITRKGGLSLTPPAMPVADSPAALAAGGSGPTFMDFTRWGHFTGGSFLATERRLRAATARLGSGEANHARLVLARFYLANDFAAEALGLINLMQAQDPSLQSDRQLQTMRAAASYMMGRYRDAHNAIAAGSFDDDPHAALWRGLTEAAQEDWTNARADLDRADAIVKLYPAAWQARARIAKAETALALGHLEIADAAILRLPHDVDRKLAIRANLVRARLLAAEDHGGEAGALFNAIEKSGDERAAAESIYYRTEAALRAGVLNRPGAIKVLEQLHYRWRGDLLELKTLRKLASLYFDEKRWRDGLRTLRIAAANFPGEDQARRAQDDMRSAFDALFIGGKADKLKAVDALAIFYDFIDLTPIGPQGDDMIRRMADRLVTVDLLAPAETLLKYQIDNRLDGIARAQVATRLAVIYLMDQKAQSALDTLRATQIAGLPDDVNHERIILEARAFAALKQWNNALDLIAVDDSSDTVRLRADIYWESGNWAIAGQKAEELLGERWNDTAPLTPLEREQVMRAAVAYSLSNDEASLDRLRDRFGPKMKASPDANAFTVLAQRIDAHGVAFRDAAAQIASIDTLQAFMRDFKKKLDATPATLN